MTAPRGSSANKAVRGGVLQHVSASQVKTFQMCQRKWWYEKVAGLSTPSTGSQALGTEIHLQLENWFLDGKEPEHMSARRALRHLPKRSPGLLIEAPLEEPSLFLEGVSFKGFIDLLNPTDPTTIGILDYKTSGNFAYAKTEEELLRDVQMGAYGYWAHLKFPNATRLKLAHVYIHTKKTDAKIVEVEASWDDVDGVWRGIQATVSEMREVAKAADASDVKPNWGACGAFGGCPFRGNCDKLKPMTLADRLEAAMGPKPEATSVPLRMGGDATRSGAVAELDGAVVPGGNAGRPVTASTSLTLYIDCLPIKSSSASPTVRLEDLIAQRAAVIATKAGVADVRLMPYATGKAELAAAFKKDPPTGTIIAQSGDLSSTVLEVLIPVATDVVRGVR